MGGGSGSSEEELGGIGVFISPHIEEMSFSVSIARGAKRLMDSLGASRPLEDFWAPRLAGDLDSAACGVFFAGESFWAFAPLDAAEEILSLSLGAAAGFCF